MKSFVFHVLKLRNLFWYSFNNFFFVEYLVKANNPWIVRAGVVSETQKRFFHLKITAETREIKASYRADTQSINIGHLFMASSILHM